MRLHRLGATYSMASVRIAAAHSTWRAYLHSGLGRVSRSDAARARMKRASATNGLLQSVTGNHQCVCPVSSFPRTNHMPMLARLNAS